MLPQRDLGMALRGFAGQVGVVPLPTRHDASSGNAESSAECSLSAFRALAQSVIDLHEHLSLF